MTHASDRLPRRRHAAFSGTTFTDWALGSLGFCMAATSASFAAYMIATAPEEVTGSGSKDFNIFVKFDRRSPALATHGPSQVAAAPSPAEAAAGPAIDPTPVGTIPHDVNQTEAPRALPATPPLGAGALGEFHVRDVFGDRALIEHRSKLSLVRAGSILAGAGEVLAIERRDGAWIVKTAGGIIGGS